MTTDFGRTFTGGPDLAVRCVGPDGVAVGVSSIDGTLCIHPVDPTAAVDLRLRSSEFDPLVLLVGTGGHGAAAALQACADGDRWRRIPPFDFDPDELTVSPIIGADAVVAHETFDSPVGAFNYYDTFVDGVLTARRGGLPPVEPLVQTRMSFAARVSPPHVPLLEQLEGARLRGRDDAALMFVAGLYDRAPVRHALRGKRTATNRALTLLAAHTCTDQFRDLVTHSVPVVR